MPYPPEEPISMKIFLILIIFNNFHIKYFL